MSNSCCCKVRYRGGVDLDRSCTRWLHPYHIPRLIDLLGLTYWTEMGRASKSACCSGGTIVFAFLLMAAVPRAESVPGAAERSRAWVEFARSRSCLHAWAKPCLQPTLNRQDALLVACFWVIDRSDWAGVGREHEELKKQRLEVLWERDSWAVTETLAQQQQAFAKRT